MVTPKLTAQFDLDPTGQPKSLLRGSTRHYDIRLQLVGAPQDTYAVTYQLHDSYYDPVREARDPETRFSEHLTSYGDFTVNAKIRSRQGVFTVALPLSEALRDGHSSSMSPAIRAAIEELSTR
jgi:hypothetical protein